MRHPNIEEMYDENVPIVVPKGVFGIQTFQRQGDMQQRCSYYGVEGCVNALEFVWEAWIIDLVRSDDYCVFPIRLITYIRDFAGYDGQHLL
ncbi:hypothetical protein VNO78_10235 [Psophocarpus tetragonolobus]|uniref:Uncharacterized protein n=1 Tax=Psophocarpus tetragonolobus TaxID=3891 RepID=A0AAN9SLN8_PSOTE